ncbi:MAG: hypothetical protein ACI8PZ_006340 [Myxococcota bacterium]|jgi:hypothetical protein
MFRRGFVFVGAAALGCTSAGVEGTVPTWDNDIQPMTAQYCVRCHNPDGTAPVAFTEYEVVEGYAEYMLARIDAGEMPPPVSDPECRDYVGSEHLSVPADKRDLLEEWISVGKPRGPGYAEPDAPSVDLELPGADLEVYLAAPYDPVFEDPSNPNNEYRCFAIEHGRPETFFITGLGPLVDAYSLVHHIVVYKDSDGDIPPHDPALGWNCIDEMDGLELGMIAGWAPGALPVQFPEGSGYRVEPHERIVIQMHYYNGAPEEPELTDHSGYAFTTTEAVDMELFVYPYGREDFLIPAGDDDYSFTSFDEIPESIDLGDFEIPFPTTSVFGVFPHMHQLGRSYSLVLERPDGSEECVLRSDAWDFDNQLTYMLREPIDIGPGDTVKWTCSWNNSVSNPDLIIDPPVDIRYGERTDEEMCWAFTLGALSL